MTWKRNVILVLVRSTSFQPRSHFEVASFGFTVAKTSSLSMWHHSSVSLTVLFFSVDSQSSFRSSTQSGLRISFIINFMLSCHHSLAFLLWFHSLCLNWTSSTLKKRTTTEKISHFYRIRRLMWFHSKPSFSNKYQNQENKSFIADAQSTSTPYYPSVRSSATSLEEVYLGLLGLPSDSDMHKSSSGMNL